MNYSSLIKNQDNINNQNLRKRTVLCGNEYLSCAPQEIRNRNGILLRAEQDSFNLTDKDFETGIMLMGSTGCGKTFTIMRMLDQIMPSLRADDAMIIFDSKRDFLERYYDRNNPNHIVISISPKDKEIAKGWNIYKELLSDEGYLDADSELAADEISRALFKSTESHTQPFFHIAAADTIKALICTEIFNSINSNNTRALKTSELCKILNNTSGQAELVKRICRFDRFKYIEGYFGDKANNQGLGVIGNIQSMKSNILTPISRNFRSGEFSMHEIFKEKGKVVFLEYDVRYENVLKTFYSILFDRAITSALSNRNGNKYFICDEASLLPYVSKLQMLLNYGRAFHCRTIFGLQSLAQLKANCGQESEYEAEAVLAGFCNLFAFQNTDYLTRDYIKQRIGETFEVYNYGAQNISHDGHSVSDSELHNLKVGEAFIDIKNYPPFRFRFSK